MRRSFACEPAEYDNEFFSNIHNYLEKEFDLSNEEALELLTALQRFVRHFVDLAFNHSEENHF